MTEQELSQEVGRFAYVGDFQKLKSQVGFRRASWSLFVRFRYIVRLYVIRELSIWLILINNFEKIPKSTPSRLFIGILKRSALMKNLIKSTVNRLQKKLIYNI